MRVFYASVVYALFNRCGLTVITEDAPTTGRIDFTVLCAEEKAYIIEFKVVEEDGKGKALEQIKTKRYFEKYANRYPELYLIGIEFSKSTRNIVDFKWEKIKNPDK